MFKRVLFVLLLTFVSIQVVHAQGPAPTTAPTVQPVGTAPAPVETIPVSTVAAQFDFDKLINVGLFLLVVASIIAGVYTNYQNNKGHFNLAAAFTGALTQVMNDPIKGQLAAKLGDSLPKESVAQIVNLLTTASMVTPSNKPVLDEVKQLLFPNETALEAGKAKPPETSTGVTP